MTRRRRIGDERGVALVEFALVLPMLLLVMVGIFEFGKMFNYWIDTTHLANESARWAVVDRAPNGTTPGIALHAYACGKASTAELKNGLKVSVDFDVDPNDGNETYLPNPLSTAPQTPPTLDTGDAVRVRVERSYKVAGFLSNIPIFGNVLGNATTFTFKGTSVMRIERLTGAGNTAPGTYSAGVKTWSSTCT